MEYPRATFHIFHFRPTPLVLVIVMIVIVVVLFLEPRPPGFWILAYLYKRHVSPFPRPHAPAPVPDFLISIFAAAPPPAIRSKSSLVNFAILYSLYTSLTPLIQSNLQCYIYPLR